VFIFIGINFIKVSIILLYSHVTQDMWLQVLVTGPGSDGIAFMFIIITVLLLLILN